MPQDGDLLRTLLSFDRVNDIRPTLFGRPKSRDKWTPRFRTWAEPLSNSEDQKCQNAESIIRSALDGHSEPDGLDLSVFAQGSYKANTNVRTESDVDICVRCSNTFYYDPLPLGLVASNIGIYPATLDFVTYKSKIERALYNRFTIHGVKVGDKAFNVKENTYRINVDVVPTFEYRKYYWQHSNLYFKTGSCFFTNSGKFIVNWPEETYANGVAKNDRTARRYKKVVRVLKGIRNEMDALGYSSAKKIASFQISCLAYNIMDGFYNSGDLYDDVKGVVGQIWYHAYNAPKSVGWTEIDEIKLMFPSDQPGKRQEVAAFFWDVMKYAELEN